MGAIVQVIMNREIKRFSRKIREIRLNNGMSQGDMAKILKVHRTYISSMERGLRNPSLLTIRKIAKALKVNPRNII